MGFREIDYRLIIRRSGAERRRKLISFEKMAKVRTGRIVNLREQVCELLAIAQWQTDSHLHVIICIEPALRLKLLGNPGHMPPEDLRLAAQ